MINVKRPILQLRLYIAFCGCAALAGCMVGPDYRTPPAPPADTSYTAAPLPEQTASAPGAAGLYQVNVQLTSDVPIGDAIPMYVIVTLSDGTVVQTNPVNIAIQAADPSAVNQ